MERYGTLVIGFFSPAGAKLTKKTSNSPTTGLRGEICSDD
jgi:hypothetical protein